MTTSPLPRFPRALFLAARPLPLAPLSLGLGRLARRVSARHPGLLRRLGPYAAQRFLVDPTDLPFVLLIVPQTAEVSAHRRGQGLDHAARIAGPLSAFLAMMHGAQDGDALFFSRDLVIEGDTGAVLALRNAIDDSELDLTEEIAAMAGPLASLARHTLGRTERLTGLSLHRTETEAWA